MRSKKTTPKRVTKFENIELRNGCYVSRISVSPKDWDTNSNAIESQWQITYRFKDPAFKDQYPNGKQVKVQGMNVYPSIRTRREVTKALLEDEYELLTEQHYNPITKTFMVDEDKNYIIHPNTPIIPAMRECIVRLKCSDQHQADMRSMINFLEKAAADLSLLNLPVCDVTRVHLIKLIEKCKKSPIRANKYRSYCSIIWKKFVSIQCAKSNVADGMERDQVIKDETKVRETLTLQERQMIDQHLYDHCYTFWRFMQVFFHSGSRIKELLSIKVSDVDLEGQKYRVLIKKRKQPTILHKPIKDTVLHLWKEVLRNAPPDAYVFGDDLSPKIKDKPLRADQISRRWRGWVKKSPHLQFSNGLGIKKDFYPLKHLHTTLMTDHVSELLIISQAQEFASEFNSHTSKQMVDQIYDVKSKKRKDTLFKKIDISFAGV